MVGDQGQYEVDPGFTGRALDPCDGLDQIRSPTMRPWIVSLLALSTCLAAPRAWAQTDEQEWDGGFGERAERRSGFTAGLSTGLMVGKARGYPNVAGQIDNPEYEANTRVVLGSDYTLWIGGALKDWFTFGIGTSFNGMGDENKLLYGGFGFLFRVETFPLFYRGGVFRDLALHGDFGISAGVIVDDEEEEVANGGALSLVGLGAAYEVLHFGSFAFGPIADYRFQFSQSMRVHQGIFGVRLVFYGGP